MIINPMIPIPFMLLICVLAIGILLYKHKTLPILEILLVLSLFVINLRPMIPSGTSKIVSNNIDIVFAVDTTISMNALDYNGTNTRLSGIKNDLNHIIDKFSGARFSLITFDNDARVTVPFTKDTYMLKEAISILKPYNSYYAIGSNLNIPYNELNRVLKSSYDTQDKFTVLFFISDGEITDESSLTTYTYLKDYVQAGAVLGYGTTEGGKMMEEDYVTGEEEYITDNRVYPAEDAVSKLDEANLNSIAEDLGIPYIHMTSTSDIDSLLDIINAYKEEGLEIEKIDSYKDLYYIFVIPTLVILFILLYKYKEISV